MTYDSLSGPGRLKACGRTSQAEGSENGPDRLKALEGSPDSESGSDWLKAWYGGSVMLKTLYVLIDLYEEVA